MSVLKNTKSKWKNIVLYVYMVLPMFIFTLGWLRWYWAVIFGLLILCACIKAIKDDSMEEANFIFKKENRGVLLTTLFILVMWVYLSGIGGYCFQNDDHSVRNAMFRALVEYDWPVISITDGNRGLVYYIGFWLPAACIGKVFGIELGYAGQFVWAVLGVFCVYCLICVYRKKVDILPVIFMIFFSGLDYVGVWLLGKNGIDLKSATHLEWWAGIQFSAMTTQLFWVFNQAIPAWIATALIFNQKNCKNMLFILSLIMLQSTFPFVGLIPIVIYLYLKRVWKDKKNWKEIFTFQNIVGVVVIGGCVFLYLLRNVSGGEITNANKQMMVSEPLAQMLKYILFFFLEAGIYLCFAYKHRKKDPLVYVLAIILWLCPFIKVGGSADFCMRASIPALFILMIMCIDVLEKLYKKKRKYLLVVYCVILLFGAITSFNEIHRTIIQTIQRAERRVSVRCDETDIESGILRSNNFSGEISGSLFYEYFAKDI